MLLGVESPLSPEKKSTFAKKSLGGAGESQKTEDAKKEDEGVTKKKSRNPFLVI
jgi:hypothetical protein